MSDRLMQAMPDGRRLWVVASEAHDSTLRARIRDEVERLKVQNVAERRRHSEASERSLVKAGFSVRDRRWLRGGRAVNG